MRVRIPLARLCLASLCLVAPAAATPALAEPADHEYRVLGLFQEDREQDLRDVVRTLDGVELVEVDYQTGQATLRFDAETVLPGRKTAEQITQGMDQRVRGASRSTFELLPPSRTDRERLRRVEIEVVGLDCKGCSYGAYLAICKLEGVENATASFRLGKVVAWIDPQVTNRAALVEALENKRVEVRTRP